MNEENETILESIFQSLVLELQENKIEGSSIVFATIRLISCIVDIPDENGTKFVDYMFSAIRNFKEKQNENK